MCTVVNIFRINWNATRLPVPLFYPTSISMKLRRQFLRSSAHLHLLYLFAKYLDVASNAMSVTFSFTIHARATRRRLLQIIGSISCILWLLDLISSSSMFSRYEKRIYLFDLSRFVLGCTFYEYVNIKNLSANFVFGTVTTITTLQYLLVTLQDTCNILNRFSILD